MDKIMENEQKVIFGCFVKGELQGWRQDTFGTLGMDWAKIYPYSPAQVGIIVKNTKQELNNVGTTFMKHLLGNENAVAVNTQGETLDKNVIIDQITKGEQEKKSWGEFELRVYSSPFQDYDEHEKWKMEAFNKSLPEPLEIHKFKTLENEN